MKITELINKFNQRKALTKEKFKQAEEDLKIQKLLEERQKTSEERQLERFMEDERQKNIKKQLDKFNDKKTKELWKGNYSVLKGQMNILKEDKKIMTKQNMFLDNKTKIPFVQRSMYFN
jgi:AAA15 family ATPase/GTPase